MCGRYALGIRAAYVRHQLQQSGMPVDEAPDDEATRQTYNFAPGHHGLVYRADTPDWGAGTRDRPHDGDGQDSDDIPTDVPSTTRYKLQSMKWGLVPFWTKRNPDYGSVMRTINARDDSLAAKGGMWSSMKQRKRCIVVAQGFYEWLKKNGGREKIPHFTKRKDGQLMCFAGLWDCVQYEGSEEKHYTYTIVTTDSNKQLSFLHDRMPVILENGSPQIQTWLDPERSEWSMDLLALLKPYEGELECYPVSKDVGKVGNDSPSFIVPVASPENKHNIANFFGAAAKKKDDKASAKTDGKDHAASTTQQDTNTESNAPKPAAAPSPPATEEARGVKRERDVDGKWDAVESPPPAKKHATATTMTTTPAKKTRSATSNHVPGTKGKSPIKNAGHGTQKITAFLKSS